MIKHVVALLMLIGITGCAAKSSSLVTGDPNALARGYLLPSSRPGEELRLYLEEQVFAQPQNAVYHRDLGSLYQSRTSLVNKDEKLRLVDLANAHLELAFESMPDDPQTLMFLGLARASKASNSKRNLLSRMSLAIEGFKLMDKAVGNLPNNFSLRLLRAKAGILAPAIMGRTRLLSEDYAFIYEQTLNKNEIAPHLKALGLIFLGEYNIKKHPEKAMKYWRMAAEGPTSFAGEARQRMEGRFPGF